MRECSITSIVSERAGIALLGVARTDHLGRGEE
jgi:hypothetical protein